MGLATSLKYGLLKKPLSLKKKRDFCPSGKPKITAIFIHGIASDSSAFKNTISYLSGTQSLRDVRFISFDLLGAGKSYSSDKLKYTLDDQLEALHNSIAKLKLTTPLVLVGHSMGSLISLNYADRFKKSVKKLILASPPIYKKEELEHPAFKEGIKVFEKFVGSRHKGAEQKKQFGCSMKNIVLSAKNYDVLSKLTTKTVILYGELDKFISAKNIEDITKKNAKHISAIKTIGNHPMSRDKYHKIVPILEEVLNETI
jgi:surfactin synthase thioesterase subunit